MTRGRRRTLVAGVILAGWTIGLAAVAVPTATATGTPPAVTPAVASGASPATPTAKTPAQVATPTIVAAGAAAATPAARDDGKDAPWLRFSVIGLLGLALGGGAVVQYRGTADAPPHRPQPRRPRRRPAPDAIPAPARITPLAAAPGPAPTPPAAARPDPAPVLSAFPRQEPAPMPVAPTPPRPTPLRRVEAAPARTPAEEACARAIAAAFRYDRRATLTTFAEALDADPALKPSSLPDFWEMPASGHADLAAAYLRREQPLDARSVVTMALLTFPHNRELTALLREIAPYRFDRPA